MLKSDLLCRKLYRFYSISSFDVSNVGKLETQKPKSKGHKSFASTSLCVFIHHNGSGYNHILYIFFMLRHPTMRRIISFILLSNLNLYSWGSSNGYEHERHDHQCSHSDRDEIIVNEGESLTYTCESRKTAKTEIAMSKSKSWNWDIDAKHRCNIEKISFKDLYKRYKSGLPPLHYEPVILYNENPHKKDIANNCISSEFTYMMSKENITAKTFSEEFEVTLSSSNSFSAHRRKITLGQYMNETMNSEIFPDQLSNLTWYLFGETYSKEWKDVLRYYCLPPCQTCTDDLR